MQMLGDGGMGGAKPGSVGPAAWGAQGAGSEEQGWSHWGGGQRNCGTGTSHNILSSVDHVCLGQLSHPFRTGRDGSRHGAHVKKMKRRGCAHPQARSLLVLSQYVTSVTITGPSHENMPLLSNVPVWGTDGGKQLTHQPKINTRDCVRAYGLSCSRPGNINEFQAFNDHTTRNPFLHSLPPMQPCRPWPVGRLASHGTITLCKLMLPSRKDR